MNSYEKLFDPDVIDIEPKIGQGKIEPKDKEIYVYSKVENGESGVDQTILAVNAAIVTGRPLLLYGPPGSGKSSLAPNVARFFRIPFHQLVITSRTELQDLLWRFDAVRRLSDARVGVGVEHDSKYIRIGILWKAFLEPAPIEMISPYTPSCVVLLDEIDKADPDLPDGLLGPLGDMSFVGPDDKMIEAQSNPLIVITSNNERELSRPFLRRCIGLTLHPPSKEHLVTIAKARFGENLDDVALYERVADFVVGIGRKSENTISASPSTAEFLDAIRSCKRLNITPDGPIWETLSRIVLTKSDIRSDFRL